MNAISSIPESTGLLVPWAQQEDEPIAEFKLFTYYLSMGLKRSVKAAAMEWADGDKERTPNQVITEWSKLAQKNSWKDRADLFDIAMMDEEFKTVRLRLGQALVKMSEKVLAKAEEATLEPTTFKELVDSIHAIHALLPTTEESTTFSIRQKRNQRPETKLLGRSV